MSENQAATIAGYDRCIQLAQTLDACLEEERTFLIELKMEELAETTLRKATLSRELVQERHRLRELVSFLVPQGLDENTFLTEVSDETIRGKHREWNRTWNRTRFSCESNQRLLKNSARNLGMLSDHLKRLLGDKSRYSNQGKRVDSPATGRVIGAKTA